MENKNSKVYKVLHEKTLSDTQKIVAHVISFGKKPPVLAVQHVWRKDKNDQWQPGKMAVMTGDLIVDLLENKVLEQSIEIIKNNSNQE